MSGYFTMTPSIIDNDARNHNGGSASVCITFEAGHTDDRDRPCFNVLVLVDDERMATLTLPYTAARELIRALQADMRRDLSRVEDVLLPAGWYSATITAAEVKQTKTGTGSYLKVEFTVSDPAGRKVWSNYNVRNANSAAETIGRQQLAELLRAIGKPRLGDTDELLGSAVSIKVKVREAANGYDASNEVAGSKSLDGAAPPAPAAKAAAPAPAKAAPPWAKR